MTKTNESKKLIKGVAKELQHVMEVENLLCTFLSLDNEEKINELLGKIKNKKGADAWFNKVIKNTAHLINEDNFKDEFETYVNTNRASLTEIIVNYDSSVTETVLNGFLNNTENKSDAKEETKKEEYKKEQKEEDFKEDKDKKESKEGETVKGEEKTSKEDVKVRTSGEELRKIFPKDLYNRLPKSVLNCPIEGDASFDEEAIQQIKPFVDLYMKTSDLDKLEKLSKEIDSKELKFTPGKNVQELILAKGFDTIANGDVKELKELINEDDIKLIEIVSSDLGMDVMKDIVRVGAKLCAEANGEEEVPEEIVDQQLEELKKTYKTLIEALRAPELNDEKDFKIKVLNKEIEVKASKYDDEVISNVRKAIIKEFELIGSGAAMLDYSVDLVLEAMKENDNKWSEECYMKVFGKIRSSEKKPLTMKYIKSLAI